MCSNCIYYKNTILWLEDIDNKTTVLSLEDTNKKQNTFLWLEDINNITANLRSVDINNETEHYSLIGEY